MKLIEILCSAGPRATQYRIWGAIFVITFYCCNPVKQVLKSNDKTQQVVDKWLECNPVKIDTNYVYKPGDTITHLLIGYDTTVLRDTLNRIDTIRIKERTLKLQTVHDTVTRTINGDNRLLNECQRAIAGKEAAVQDARAKENDARAAANKWIIRFWSLIGIIVVILAVTVFLKFKPGIKL
jgi:hypothetical protein